jgi:hypothetical protein
MGAAPAALAMAGSGRMTQHGAPEETLKPWHVYIG